MLNTLWKYFDKLYLYSDAGIWDNIIGQIKMHRMFQIRYSLEVSKKKFSRTSGANEIELFDQMDNCFTTIYVSTDRNDTSRWKFRICLGIIYIQFINVLFVHHSIREWKQY